MSDLNNIISVPETNVEISEESYREALGDALMSRGNTEIAVKPDATDDGEAVVALSFDVTTDVRIERVSEQFVLHELQALLDAISEQV